MIKLKNALLAFKSNHSLIYLLFIQYINSVSMPKTKTIKLVFVVVFLLSTQQ